MIIFLIILICLVMCFTYKNTEDFKSDQSGIPKIDTNKCSRSCCINTGYPYPIELLENDMTPDEKKNYVPSNFFCNNGCLCLKKSDKDIIINRGNNI